MTHAVSPPNVTKQHFLTTYFKGPIVKSVVASRGDAAEWKQPHDPPQPVQACYHGGTVLHGQGE